MSPRTSLASLTLLALATAAGAQSSFARAGAARPTPEDGQPIHLGGDEFVLIEEYVNPAFVAPSAVLASELPRRQPGRVAMPDPVSVLGRQELAPLCYDNGRLPSPRNYYSMFPDQELVDFAYKSCGSSGVATRFGVGCRSTTLDAGLGGPGTMFGLRIYAGGTGGGPGELGTLVGEYTISTTLGAPAPGFTTVITFERAFPTPLILPDGPIAFSYVERGLPFDAALVVTDGGSCASSSYDPLTGTQDCVDDYDYPADGGGFYYGDFSPVPGEGSLFFRLWEEDPVAALALPYNVAPNPSSFTCDAPAIGRLWTGTVDLTTTGHTNALVIGFDGSTEVPLGGGQVLLIADGGSGELLGFAPRPGPLATFTIPVPNDLAVLGRYVGTQAIHYGGVTPFALSNAMDLIIGTN